MAGQYPMAPMVKFPTLEEMMNNALEDFKTKSEQEQSQIENSYKQQGITGDRQMALAYARDKNPGVFDAMMEKQRSELAQVDTDYAKEQGDMKSKQMWSLIPMALAGLGGAYSGGAQGAQAAMAPIMQMQQQQKSELKSERDKKKQAIKDYFAQKREDMKFQEAEAKDQARYEAAQQREDQRFEENKRRYEEDKLFREQQAKATADWKRTQEQWRREDKAAEREMKKMIAEMKAKKDNIPEGAKAVDKDYAKEYNEWTSTGRAGYAKNMKRLSDARDMLVRSKQGLGMASGPLAAMTPKFLKPDELNAIEQNVRGAAMGALKATLGAQFTEKEGERIMQIAFDPELSEEENIKKVDSAMQEIRDIANTNESKAKYFEEKGNTIVGWKSPEKQEPSQEEFVTMKFPDGRIQKIPASAVERAKQFGGVVQ